jgi:hypothetical protein
MNMCRPVCCLWTTARAMLVAGLCLSAVGGGPLDEIIAASTVVPVSATVGVLIFARVPGNSVGWILLAAGVFGGLLTLAAGYRRGLVTDTMQPAHVSLWLREPEAQA